MTNKLLIQLGTICGSLMAILGLFWFVGEPALERYVDAQIELHDELEKKESSGTVKLRELLGYKMGVENDEVHIELGRLYKNNKFISKKLDSVLTVLNRFDKAVLKEFNYYHSDNLLKELE